MHVHVLYPLTLNLYGSSLKVTTNKFRVNNHTKLVIPDFYFKHIFLAANYTETHKHICTNCNWDKIIILGKAQD